MKKPSKPKKRFSFPFLISIPANFAICLILFVTILDLLVTDRVENKDWALFGFGFIAALGFTVTSKLTKFRVFIHELKHSMVVNLSGNKVNDFKVGKNTGHVEYSMYQDRVHYAPLIALAPYFFPLFSLPIVIATIFLHNNYPEFMIPLVGFSLALDLSFSITEIHPYQSDFQSIIGGFFTSALYLAGFYLMWSMICLIMAIFGHEAFYRAFYIAFDMGQKLWLRHY